MTDYTRFGTHNMVLPPEGPKVFPSKLDFREKAMQKLDFLNVIQQGFVSYIQGGFFDNSVNANPLAIRTDQIQQIAIIPPFSQAYLPLFISDSAILEFTTIVAGDCVCPVILTNVPVTPHVWKVT